MGVMGGWKKMQNWAQFVLYKCSSVKTDYITNTIIDRDVEHFRLRVCMILHKLGCCSAKT